MTAAIRLALLVAGFAAAGEVALRRRSRTPVSWNESFWAGAGIFGAALILLSRFSRAAVSSLSAALPALVIVALVLRWRRIGRPETAPSEDGGARHPVNDAVAFSVAALVVLVFAVLNARTGFVTDGFSIWLSKARVLALDGRLDPAFRRPEVLGRVADYPPLVPLCEALLGRGAGEFDDAAAKSVFPVFLVSLLVGSYGATRRLLPRSLSVWAPVLVALLPWVSTDWNAGGLADLPMAAAVATMVGAWLGRVTESDLRSADSWIAGAILLTKAEGAVTVFGLAFAGVAFSGSRPRRTFASAATLLPVTAFAFLVVLHRRWFGMAQGVYGPLDAAHMAVALRRIREVAAECAEMALSWRGWGMFWIAAVGAGAVVLSRGSRAARALAVFVLLTPAMFASIFLFTNWGFPGAARYGASTLAFHVQSAFPRLIEQITGPAAVVILVACHAMAPSPRFHGSLVTVVSAGAIRRKGRTRVAITDPECPRAGPDASFEVR